MQSLPDGRISIQSEDATVRLVVHPHGKRFAVCFPLLVSLAEGTQHDPEAAQQFTYFWQTQLFATADHPTRWAHPLALATEALHTPALFNTQGPAESGAEVAVPPAADANAQDDAAQASPEAALAAATRNGEAGAHGGERAGAGEVSVMRRTTHLPQAAAPRPEGPNFVQEGTWWTECSLEQLPDDVRAVPRVGAAECLKPTAARARCPQPLTLVQHP